MATFINYLPFIGSILVVILGAYFGRNKTKADAADAVSEAASRLLEPLNRRIELLEKVTAAQEVELIFLRRGVNTLIAQLRRVGCEPEWTPDSKPVEDKANR
jgi:class 3 adenylate cyclase